MKVAFYPGSFNPLHAGHEDIAWKALRLFDKIVFLQLTNSAKTAPTQPMRYSDLDPQFDAEMARIEVISHQNMSLNSAIGNYLLGQTQKHQYAIVRGIRNEKDFCDEQILQYTYEDMGIKIPIFFVISDRQLVHISSTVERMKLPFMSRGKV